MIWKLFDKLFGTCKPSIRKTYVPKFEVLQNT